MTGRAYAVAGLAAGTAAALSAVPVSRGEVPSWEADLFGWINGLPDIPAALVWLPMQVGNVGAALVVAGALWLKSHPRRSGLAVIGGVGTWLLAKAIKAVVERGRPAALFDEVVLRADAESSGLGWVSGHAAVTAALATIVWPVLTRRSRVALALAIAPMYVLRVYAGGHLPLDMISGGLVGIAVGSCLLVASGESSRRRQLSDRRESSYTYGYVSR